MARIDVDGIYKHSPMTEAQILAEKNDDREIVINTAQVTEAAPVSSSDTDRTKYNPSYTCETESGKVRRNVATLETLGLDGSQATNGICGADLIGINVTKSYGFIDSAGTVQEVIDELDTAMSGGTPGQILTSTQNGLEWKSGISTPSAFVEATNSTPLNLKGNDILTTANVNIINTADGYFSVSTDKTASGYASTLSLGTSGFLVNSSSYNTQSSSGPTNISSSNTASFRSEGPLTVSSNQATATFQGAGPTTLQSTGGAPVTVKSNGSASDHSDLVLTPNAGTISVNASTADHTLSMYSKSVVSGNTSYAQLDLNDSSGAEIHTNASTIKFTSEGGAPITSTVTGDNTHYTTVTESVTGLSVSVAGASSPLSFTLSGDSTQGTSSAVINAKNISLIAASVPTDTGTAAVSVGGPMIGTLLFNTTGVSLINPTLPTSVTTTELKLPAYNNAFDSTTTHKVMVHAASDGGVELAEMSDLTNEQFGLDDNTSSGTMLYVEQVADTVEPGDPQTYHPEVTKLAPGTTGQVLTVGSSGAPEWANGGGGGGITNPVEELLVMEKGFQLKDAENTWTDPYDGHVYKTVTIGTQTWLAENYQGHYQWAPNNNSANVPVYGGLYYGYGIEGNNVPDGWHLPSQDEWNVLINYVMNTYSLTRAEACAALCNNEEGWTDLTWQTNTTGMNLVAPGSFYQGQGVTGFNTMGYYFTSDAYFADSSFHMCMTFSKNQIGSHEVKWSGGINQFNQYGASVRLVRDANASDDPQILKTVTTLKRGATNNTIPTSRAVWNECLRNVITAGGDLVVGNSGGTQVQRLGIGTEGQTLMVSSSGMPYWASMYLGTFTTANRPSGPVNGSFGFDITIRNVVWFIDGAWVNASGSSV